jgi:hypothetical protein
MQSFGSAAPASRYCPPSEHFDNARLPYRWVPGLEVRRLPEDYYRTAPRIEVSHTFDWTPGPLWLYAAPGSGVWWDPGKRVVARNMAAAALLWHSAAQVAAAIREQAPTNPDYAHWRAAFDAAVGPVPWEEIVRGAAAGNESFELFAMAGELLMPLLTPPAGVDSLLLLLQMHYWPRWFDEAHDGSRYGYAPRLLLDARAHTPMAEDIASRVRLVPEIVDFRVQGTDKPRAFWQRRLLRGDAEGRTACERGPAGESCLGCTRKMHVLCECAFRTRYRAGPLVKSTFVGENARRCCLAWTANRSNGFEDVSPRELWRVRNEAYQRERAERKRDKAADGGGKRKGRRKGKRG